MNQRRVQNMSQDCLGIFSRIYLFYFDTYYNFPIIPSVSFRFFSSFLLLHYLPYSWLFLLNTYNKYISGRRAKAGRPARTYIQQLCEDTGCCPEDLPRAMNDREEWRERVRDIRATSATWWWYIIKHQSVIQHHYVSSFQALMMAH